MSVFLSLDYEPAIEALGPDYYDEVPAAEFPCHLLRFRNDDLLPLLGCDPAEVKDEDFIFAFGQFEGIRPFLAMRYHGYQFGEYNPYLGDGRGFLYGQIRGTDGWLYDLGTKGSGRTPYSRGADGRLTLKGGVREVLAGEMLYRLGVRTSRCLSLVETGESLWRGDEPSPTRSSVMVRLNRSHVRFGTFERLHYLERYDLSRKLLDRVLEWYYPAIAPGDYAGFYAALVRRTAELAAQWMAAGFCHGVLNSDNMSVVGESFDYGPYAFVPTYDTRFTAAYFDYSGMYCYGNQPQICHFNLERLQMSLVKIVDRAAMKEGLSTFKTIYHQTYLQCMVRRLGFDALPEDAAELVRVTLKALHESQDSYPDFFIRLRQQFSPQWREDVSAIAPDLTAPVWEAWRQVYHHRLQFVSDGEMEEMGDRLRRVNPAIHLLRPEIERVWQAIDHDNDWEPFRDLLDRSKE